MPSLARWDCGFESHRGHGFLSVVCYQVEVSATSWALVQRSPTDCDTSLCVIKKHREWGGPGPIGAVAPKRKKTLQWINSFTILALKLSNCTHWFIWRQDAYFNSSKDKTVADHTQKSIICLLINLISIHAKDIKFQQCPSISDLYTKGRDCRRPPRCIWDLRSQAMSRSFVWDCLTTWTWRRDRLSVPKCR